MRQTGMLFLHQIDLMSKFFSHTLLSLVTAGEEHYQVRGENALMKMKKWSRHSDWNFKNKLLLIEAECYNTQKEFDKAAFCYKASIKSAQKHKFNPDEAIANELAGIFFYENEYYLESHMFFLQSIECYKKWGANAAASRVEDSMCDKFDSKMQLCQTESTSMLLDDAPKEFASKKHQLDE